MPQRGAVHRPLSLSLAVDALSTGSPKQADGMAQYMATRSLGAHPLRASQQGAALAAHRLRSSFLQRPPADDIYSCY